MTPYRRKGKNSDRDLATKIARLSAMKRPLTPKERSLLARYRRLLRESDQPRADAPKPPREGASLKRLRKAMEDDPKLETMIRHSVGKDLNPASSPSPQRAQRRLDAPAEIDAIEGTLWDNGTMKRTSNETTAFSFHGPDVDDGSMDMSDYARAIHGYAKMIRAVVVAVDNRADIPTVRISATGQGSFITAVSIVTEVTWTQALLEWFNGQTAAAFVVGATLGEAAFKGIGAVLKAAIALAKQLKATPDYTAESDDKGNTTITTPDGKTETVPTVIYQITQNNVFRDGATALISPTNNFGVESVSLDGPGEPVTLTRADRHAFKPTDEEETEREYEEELRLGIVRIAYDGKPWRFYTHPTNVAEVPKEFTAAIADDDFLDEVIAGYIPFTSQDEIRAIVRTVIPKSNGKRRIIPQHTVVRVLEIDRFEPPPTLFDEPGATESGESH